MPRRCCTRQDSASPAIGRLRPGRDAATVRAVPGNPPPCRAHERTPHHSRERLALVGSKGVLVVQFGSIHHERLVGSEDREVGVVAEGQLSLGSGRPTRSAGLVAIHSTTCSSPRPRRRASVQISDSPS